MCWQYIVILIFTHVHNRTLNFITFNNNSSPKSRCCLTSCGEEDNLHFTGTWNGFPLKLAGRPKWLGANKHSRVI